jgi:hypothetical protein
MGLFPEWNIMHELLIYWANQARKDEIGKTRGREFPQLKSLKLNLTLY